MQARNLFFFFRLIWGFPSQVTRFEAALSPDWRASLQNHPGISKNCLDQTFMPESLYSSHATGRGPGQASPE
ncbi:MAG: hypothetical protein COZ11_07735 [Deltaproteobacteria bacterium CG_4_10_14_3_um_filter_51_14]|nr:MAG: hypothetical protein COZ11_07735 [Deltaproteobacteria bacterium CG_4_10_14_3_um_filter_51_14]